MAPLPFEPCEGISLDYAAREGKAVNDDEEKMFAELWTLVHKLSHAVIGLIAFCVGLAVFEISREGWRDVIPWIPYVFAAGAAQLTYRIIAPNFGIKRPD
jgi:hypothetical protein